MTIDHLKIKESLNITKEEVMPLTEKDIYEEVVTILGNTLLNIVNEDWLLKNLSKDKIRNGEVLALISYDNLFSKSNWNSFKAKYSISEIISPTQIRKKEVDFTKRHTHVGYRGHFKVIRMSGESTYIEFDRICNCLLNILNTRMNELLKFVKFTFKLECATLSYKLLFVYDDDKKLNKKSSYVGVDNKTAIACKEDKELRIFFVVIAVFAFTLLAIKVIL